MSQIEILAPVGSEEMLRAAVFSGADAVYLGFSTTTSSVKYPGSICPQPRSILPFFRLLFAIVESPIIKIVMGSFLSAIKADNRSKAHKASNTFNFMFFIYIL